MENQYFDVAIGLNKHNERRLLIAPTSAYLQKGQTVKTAKGVYRIMFEENYVPEDSELIKALQTALDMEPERITIRINEEQFEWDVHPIDREDI